MKVPALGYTVGVQSLGRMSPGAALSAANAQAQALGKVAEVSLAWKEAEDVSAATEALTKSEVSAARIGAELENISVWNIKEMGPLPSEINYQREETNAAGVSVLRNEIPMYQIRDQMYDFMMKGMSESATDSLSSKAKKMYSKAFRSTVVTGARRIAATNVKDHRTAMAGKMRRSYDTALKTGDSVLATSIAEKGFEAGLFTDKEYDTMLETVHSDAAEGRVMLRMTSTDDVGALGLLADELSAKNTPFYQMSSQKRTAWLTRVEAKTNRLTRDAMADIKRVEEARSSETLFQALMDGEESQVAPSREQVQFLTRDMLPKDRLKYFAFHHAQSTAAKVPQSDPVELERMRMFVFGLTIPSAPGGPTIEERQQLVWNQLMGATGIDPTTGEVLGVSMLTSADVRKLALEIRDAPGFITASPKMGEFTDRGYILLTGGSKGMFDMTGGSPNAINAADFEREFIAAARKGGILFDPEKWYDTNIKRFARPVLARNRAKLMRDRSARFMVYEADGSTIREAESQRKISEAVQSGAITPEVGVQYTESMRKVTEMQKFFEEDK